MGTEMVECPVCHQDWVRRARIAGTEVGFWVCRECESVWLSADWIDARTSEFLADFMTSHGDEGSFSEVEMYDAGEQEPQ